MEVLRGMIVVSGCKSYLFFAAVFFLARGADFFAVVFFATVFLVAVFLAAFAAVFFLAFFAVVAPPGLTTATSLVPMGVPRPVHGSQPGPALKPTGVPV